MTNPHYVRDGYQSPIKTMADQKKRAEMQAWLESTYFVLPPNHEKEEGEGESESLIDRLIKKIAQDNRDAKKKTEKFRQIREFEEMQKMFGGLKGVYVVPPPGLFDVKKPNA